MEFWYLEKIESSEEEKIKIEVMLLYSMTTNVSEG